ncbi:hypothetical protein DPMN_164849 [Dreissena polymorpha]|uniref:OTU domain-containing protein n=1 Tax=Dreissena polymorpha TaxID=45954 RepID=A0A9D4IU29_DREPO|nr:hypothetical protein DPMN_164849 [Dreissena polymorpha]
MGIGGTHNKKNVRRSARENTVDGIIDDNACQNPPPNDVRSFIHNEDIHIVHNPQEASNCQFNSISHQVQNIGIYRTGMQLRQMAVDHIKENKDHYSSFTEGPIDRYLQRMANTNTFGGNLTLLALARELNCQLIVVNSQGRDYNRIISNTGIYSKDLTPFTLGFYPEIHHVSITIMNESAFRDILDSITMPSVSESESDGNLEGSDDNKVNTDKDGSECKSDHKNSFDVIENDERCTGNDENDGESVDIEEYDNETGSNTDDEEDGTVTIEDM